MSTPDAAAITAALVQGGHPGVAVHAFETLGSTNAWFGAGDSAAVAAPALCATDHQTRGAARRGRQWQALPGNLLFSVLQRVSVPPAGAGSLSLVSAVAVARTLQAETGVPIRVKWPNDLVIEGAKVAGLLIEARHEHGQRLRLVAGIGINLVEDERLVEFGGTSLARHGVPAWRRDALLVSLTGAVLSAWARFETAGWAAFERDWAELDTLRDRCVTVYAGAVGSTEAFDGIARGVAEDGSLRIDTPTGQRCVHAGEVSVRTGAVA